MRNIKMLGFAAVTALMAFGVGSASAASSLYSTGVQVSAGTWLNASLQGGSSALLSTTDGKTLVDTCISSTVTGTVEYPAGSDAKGSISSLTWGGCSVTTDTLTNGALSVGSSGAVTGTSSVITVNFGGVSCRYGTGAGTSLGTLTTGKIAINAVINEQEPKSFICPDTTKWVANYTVTSPHDLTAGGGGGGGGEEGAAMDVTPDGYYWTAWYSKAFEIKNIGWSSFTIDAWYYGTGYEVNDPSGCMGKTLTITNRVCTIYVTGKPTTPPSTLRVEGSRNGQVVASDISYLN